ncbi:hypothetical protein [Pseudoalteromonas ruthenica]|uniref:hypothetical protein n=1 Tax=Pseudoalteromonas ruthenica TaxID=151081 RepID=UPI00110ABB19|nr:hypothetical protein [Pseudoalteromonas ruthenica]TMO97568.1 hypothetical protein CWC07_13890 [Pseudoalteromonas ruthenica]
MMNALTEQRFIISRTSRHRSDAEVIARNEKNQTEQSRLRRKCMKQIEMMREAAEIGCDISDLL